MHLFAAVRLNSFVKWAAYMDEDVFGDGQEFQEVEDLPLKPKPIRGKKRSVAELEECAIHECVELKKRHSKHCVRHTRAVENMRYQAEQESPEQIAALNRVEDMDAANDSIGDFCSREAANPESKRKPLVNWTELNKKHGVTMRKSDHTQNAPYEKDQWIIRQVSKFGSTKEVATAAWQNYEGIAIVKRDHFGALTHCFAFGLRRASSRTSRRSTSSRALFCRARTGRRTRRRSTLTACGCTRTT